MGFEALIGAFMEGGAADAVGTGIADAVVGDAAAGAVDAGIAGAVDAGAGVGFNAAADSQLANLAMGADAYGTAGAGAVPWEDGFVPSDVLTNPNPGVNAGYVDPSMIASGGGGPTLGQGLNIAKGAAGLLSAGQVGKAGQAASTHADPFGSYRAQYAKMLSDLMTNPNGMLPNLPGYQAGLDAVQRAGAAQGFTNSGNMAVSLQKYGGDFFQQQAAMLSHLAGADINPTGGAQIGFQGQVDKTNLVGQSLGTIAQGALGTQTIPGFGGYF